MRLQSWLAHLTSRIALRPIARRRNSTALSSRRPYAIESLEQRSLLSVAPVAAGFETQINTVTTGDQKQAAVAMDANGDYVAVWISSDGGSYGVFAQRYSADGTTAGSQFQVNSFTAGNQWKPKVAMDDSGDFVVTWESSGQDGSGYGAYARRYNNAGVAQGTEFKVNTFTTGDQRAPEIAMNGSGSFVITWQSSGQDGSSLGVYAQRYNSTAMAQGGEIPVNVTTANSQTAPSVAIDASGNFVIGWQSNLQDGSGYGIYVRKFSAAGAALSGEIQANTYTTSTQTNCSVACDAAGDFVVAWQSNTQDGDGIFAQRFTSTETKSGAEFRVNVYTTNEQADASVGMDASGDFAITWASYPQDGSDTGIYARRYSSDGTAQGSEFLVNSYTTAYEVLPNLGMNAAGDFLISWQSQTQDGSGYGVYSQRYRHFSTAPVGDETAVNPSNTSDQGYRALAMDATGNYVVVYARSNGDSNGYGVFAQRYNSSSVAQGSEFQINVYTTGNQFEPNVAMDASGAFVVTWTSVGQDGSGEGIYARRYNSAGVAQGGEIAINTYTTGNQTVPVVAMDSAGNFVVAWDSSNQDQAGGIGVYERRFNAAGVALSGEFQVNTFVTGEQRDPSIATDPMGDFVIAWQSQNQDGSDYGIYGRRFSSAGVAQGIEFQVNSYTTNGQTIAHVAMDPKGNFVIAWDSQGQDGDSNGVFAQRYNSAGVALGLNFQLNTYTTNEQFINAMAMDSLGDFVVTWDSEQEDGDNFGEYARRFDADGIPQSPEFRVNTVTTSGQFGAAIGMDAAGDFVIVWTSKNQGVNGYDLYSQRYVATTGPVVTGVRINDEAKTIPQNGIVTPPVSTLEIDLSAPVSGLLVPSTLVQLSQNGRDISNQIVLASAGFDSFVNRNVINLVFQNTLPQGEYQLTVDQSLTDLSGQNLAGNNGGQGQGDYRLTFYVANTMPAGNGTQVATVSTGQANTSVVASDAAGDYVVAWTNNSQVFAQRYNSSGIVQGTAIRVDSGLGSNLQNVSAAMDTAGDFVIAWQSRNQDGAGFGVYARRFNSAGTALGSEFLVNTYTTLDQQHPSVAMDSVGDFVVAWDCYGEVGITTGVFAQRYNSSGVRQGGEFEVNVYTVGHTFAASNPAVGMDSVGDFVIAWDSFGEDGSSSDGVFAQRFNASGQTQQGDFQVNIYTTGRQTSPAVAMDGNGDFVVSWTGYNQGGMSSEILARRYDRFGYPQTVEIPVDPGHGATDTQQHSSVSMDQSGDFVVAWSAILAGTTNSIDIFSVNFGADSLFDRGVVNVFTTGVQFVPTVAMDANGDYVVAWQDYAIATNADATMTRRFETEVAPQLSQIEGAPLSAVASASTPLTATLTAFDRNDLVLAGATVQIATNYQKSQDLLSFTNTAKITGVWNSQTGTLTLSGVDTVANYQAALRSVTYHNTSATPNTTLTRTLVFQLNDGILTGNTLSRDLVVTAVGSPPVLSGVTGTGTYLENSTGMILASALVISDSDSANLVSATVTFTNWQGEDRLTFNNIFALQHTFTQDLTAHTATFTITGTASLDHYQTLLRSVSYSDVSDNPNTTAVRVAHFTVNDGSSNSNVVTRNIAVLAVNDPPVISAVESSALSYKANDPANPSVAISSTLLVTDADSGNLTKATVQISSGYQNTATDKDLLSFTNQLGITGSFNAATGTLTLTGTASVSNYRTALRAVMFSSSGTTIVTGNRTLSITATDNFSPPATSAAVTRTMTVTTANVPPGISGLPTTAVAYTRGAAAVSVATTAYIFDPDSANLSKVTVQITGGFQSGLDVLASTAVAGITSSFNATTGTLTLSGAAPLTSYQTALRSVTFKTTTAASTASRTLTFIADDGIATSSPSHEEFR